MPVVPIKVIACEIASVERINVHLQMSVGQVIAILRASVRKLRVLNEDEYSLMMKTNDPKKEIWFQNDKEIGFYMRKKTTDYFEYKHNQQLVKVKLSMGILKTLRYNCSYLVQDLIALFCKKYGIHNHNEFYLKRETAIYARQFCPDKKLNRILTQLHLSNDVIWLKTKLTLPEQGISGDEILVLERRLYISENLPKSLIETDILYYHLCGLILSGTCQVDCSSAIKLAAVQCQVEIGDYPKDLTKTISVLNYLPEIYQKVKKIENKIVQQYRLLRGSGEHTMKSEYLSECHEKTFFGSIFFLIQEINVKRGKLIYRLLSINRKVILIIGIRSTKVKHEWPIKKLMKWGYSKNKLIFDFGHHYPQKYHILTTEFVSIGFLLGNYSGLGQNVMNGRSHSQHELVNSTLTPSHNGTFSEFGTKTDFYETLSISRTIKSFATDTTYKESTNSLFPENNHKGMKITTFIDKSAENDYINGFQINREFLKKCGDLFDKNILNSDNKIFWTKNKIREYGVPILTFLLSSLNRMELFISNNFTTPIGLIITSIDGITVALHVLYQILSSFRNGSDRVVENLWENLKKEIVKFFIFSENINENLYDKKLSELMENIGKCADEILKLIVPIETLEEMTVVHKNINNQTEIISDKIFKFLSTLCQNLTVNDKNVNNLINKCSLDVLRLISATNALGKTLYYKSSRYCLNEYIETLNEDYDNILKIIKYHHNKESFICEYVESFGSEFDSSLSYLADILKYGKKTNDVYIDNTLQSFLITSTQSNEDLALDLENLVKKLQKNCSYDENDGQHLVSLLSKLHNFSRECRSLNTKNNNFTKITKLSSLVTKVLRETCSNLQNDIKMNFLTENIINVELHLMTALGLLNLQKESFSDQIRIGEKTWKNLKMELNSTMNSSQILPAKAQMKIEKLVDNIRINAESVLEQNKLKLLKQILAEMTDSFISLMSCLNDPKYHKIT